MGKKIRVFLWYILPLTTSLIILPFKAFAVPAYDGIFGLSQSSGYSFNARQFGDEWHNWIETTEGYGIYHNVITGDWEYYDASNVSDTGKMETKGHVPPVDGRIRAVVGEADPALLGIPKGLHPSGTFHAERRPFDFQAETGLGRTTAISGAVHLLVIGVDYATTPAHYTPDAIQPQIFGDSNSIADYYKKTSYSAVTINPAAESSGTPNDGFIGWLRLSGSHPNTSTTIDARNQQIAKNAIIAADPFMSYASYDNDNDGILEPEELSIMILVAGYEAAYWPSPPSVWAHQWNMNGVGYPVVDGKTIQVYAQFGEIHYHTTVAAHLATFGVMAHELGHLMFSLPDLYDTNKSNGDSYGVGFFDLMGSGNWGGMSGADAGSSPTQLSAWSKEYLSWGNVTTISSNQLASFPKTDGNSASIFRINTLDPNQYFLLENRQFTGYDKGFQLTGEAIHGGLAIYHIDVLKTNVWPNSNTVNADENDKGVDVEEANEGSSVGSLLDHKVTRARTDMFFFKENNERFTDTTTPGSRLKNGASPNISIIDISSYGDVMTANINFAGATAIELVSFTAEAGTGGEVLLSWETATEVDNTGFNIYRSRLRDGEYKKINDALILAKGYATSGASYHHEDTLPARGTYYYKLEDVDTNGVSTMHGPEKVRMKK